LGGERKYEKNNKQNENEKTEKMKKNFSKRKNVKKTGGWEKKKAKRGGIFK
jgi:hypothetical protein